MRRSIYFSTLLFLVLAAVGYAQKRPGFIPPSIDDEDIPIAKAELPLPEEGKDYVVQYFKGTTDGVESRIAVKELGYIIRPAMVQVISEDGRELVIEIVKKNWDDVVRSGKTRDGKFQNSFKTAMEFGIKISAKEMGIPFIVAISAGVELFPASNLFVDASTMRSGDGNAEMSTAIEELTEDNSGTSNNTILIIIAIALIAIVALLVFFIFKKKGNASFILLFFFLSTSHAGLPTQILPAFQGSISGGFLDALYQHYLKGGFQNDNPLGEDDQNHEPEVDPRGQPSLPSSCYEIARISNSGFSGGGSPSGPNGAKNPNNTAGGIAGGSQGGDAALTDGGRLMTSGGGGLTGSTAGGEAGTDIVNEDGKDRDFASERQKLLDNYQHYQDLAMGRVETGTREAQQNFERAQIEASKNLDRDLENANGDAELMAQASSAHASTISNLTLVKAETISQLESDYALDMSELAQWFSDELGKLAEEEVASNQEQQNGDAGEKDPDREPKKDPDRDQEKGTDTGDSGKGVQPPGDSENGSPGNGDEERESDREKEEGCRCLEEAYAKLQKQRYSLEKLLKIGQHTKKITDFGISFGDDFSGVHGVSGLVWQTQRAKVLESIDKFDNTYDNKYRELIQKLYDALIRIDECEKILGYENWYSHSGFIYYEFMKVRYASYK
ncbi:MAG: hypothetical protein WBN11_00540 [Eudoraea sp.]|uniref:hypothetical protein n=1 Tax=Eudoraea sp. TaxID=1979955 RepID=UPI003C787505